MYIHTIYSASGETAVTSLIYTRSGNKRRDEIRGSIYLYTYIDPQIDI